MTTTTPNCPSCGEAAQGHFCANCGAILNPKAVCGVCGKTLASGAHFCHQCGSAVGGNAATVGGHAARSTAAGTFQWGWIVPGVAVMMLVVFLIAQKLSGNAGGPAPEGDKTPLGGAPMQGPFSGGAGGGGAAPDISQMTPEQRADRLFDRVMRYGSEGKQDSARIFAPMAIQAYEMVGAMDEQIGRAHV